MSTEIVELKEFPGYGVDREGNVYSLERVVPHPTNIQLRKKLRRLRGTLNSDGYASVKLYSRGRSSSQRVHRLVAMAFLGLRPEHFVDHINRDRADNRLDNLRIATRAQININGKNAHLGVFVTEGEAHAAYCKAAKELHGEFYYDSK